MVAGVVERQVTLAVPEVVSCTIESTSNPVASSHCMRVVDC